MFFPDAVTGLVVQNAPVQVLAGRFLTVLLAGLVPSAGLIVATTVFQTGGDDRRATLLAVLRNGLLVPPLTWATTRALREPGIPVGQAISDALTGLLALTILTATLRHQRSPRHEGTARSN